MKNVKRVLIYRLGSLGDTLVAMPALRLVARSFPDAERIVLTNFSVGIKAAPMSQVLDGTGLVHRYVEYPIGVRSVRILGDLRRTIRDLDVDVLVYLTEPRGAFNTFRDALFFRLCGIGRMIGVPYAKDQRTVRAMGNGRYEYEGARLARCIGSLGDARVHDPASYALDLTPREMKEGERLLGQLSGTGALIALSVGAKVNVKDWGDANWSALLSLMNRKFPGYGVVMLGSKDERDRCEGLLRSWDGPSVNLCGSVSVRVSAAVMERARLFIGHDSGPMHLAAAVGTPCVAIFSSRNLPGEWFPQGDRHRIHFTPMPCQGCGLDECPDRDKECIRAIPVDAVMESVGKILAC